MGLNIATLIDRIDCFAIEGTIFLQTFTARSSYLCVYPYVSDETGAVEIK